MRHVIAIAFLFSLVPLVVAQEQARMPKRFHGEWAGNRSLCGQVSESSLRISEKQLDFYESRGRVMSVKSIGELEIEVALESTGEGSTWRDTRRFRLSQDGRTLTDVTRDKYHVARVRCEKTAQKRP